MEWWNWYLGILLITFRARAWRLAQGAEEELLVGNLPDFSLVRKSARTKSRTCFSRRVMLQAGSVSQHGGWGRLGFARKEAKFVRRLLAGSAKLPFSISRDKGIIKNAPLRGGAFFFIQA